MYETIPGESFKSLMSPDPSLTTPNTPSADSANRYVLSNELQALPSLPPARNGSIDKKTALDCACDEKLSLEPNIQLGEDYMVMKDQFSFPT